MSLKPGDHFFRGGRGGDAGHMVKVIAVLEDGLVEVEWLWGSRKFTEVIYPPTDVRPTAEIIIFPRVRLERSENRE